jgi:peptidoglycan-associated lipoprotein
MRGGAGRSGGAAALTVRRSEEQRVISHSLPHRGAALLVVLGLALSTAGCNGLGEKIAAAPTPDVTNAPAGAGLRVPPGSEEDFIVQVGRRTYFKGGSAELDQTAMVTLDKQAAWLTQYANWRVKIQGFADDPGTTEANLALSLKRAEAVRNYLATRGIAIDRMRVKGYGRDRLVRDCPDVDCKSQNRRVITNLEDDETV